MDRRVTWTACLLGAALVACSNAPPPDAPDYEVDMSAGRDRAPTGGGAPDDTLDETPAAPADDEPSAPKVFAGTLAAAPKAAFGGSGYCNYEVTLEDVAVEIAVGDGGVVTSATVTDHVVEKALECQYAPMKPADQSFSLAAANGTRLSFAGAATNQPKTDLVVDLAATAGGYQASLTWTRTDQKAPLAWTVTADLALAPK